MKKTIVLILATFLSLPPALAQIDWAAYSHSFPNYIHRSTSELGIIMAIKRENDAFWDTYDTSKLYDSLSKDKKFLRVRKHKIVARTAFDTSRVHFFLHGVYRNNASEYQFRVMRLPDQRLLVPWTHATNFADTALQRQSGFSAMAYLGGFHGGLGRSIIVDVKDLRSGEIASTSMASWLSIKPVITNIFTSETLDAFFLRLQSDWLPDKYSTGTFSKIPAFPSSNENLIFTLQSGPHDRKQIQYQITRNGKIYVPWKENDYDNAFVWLKNYPPGDYRIQIRFVAQPSHVIRKEYEVT